MPDNLTADDYANLSYLALLMVAVVGYAVVNRRMGIGRVLQQGAIWAFLFLGVIALFGMWDDIRQTVAPRQTVFTEDQRVELPRQADGHFYVTAGINGTAVDFVVDTGATHMVLTPEDAARIGLDPDDLIYSGSARTANGIVRTAPVRLEAVDLGGITDENVRAFVNSADMDQSLMGMSYLQRFSRLEITRDTMILHR